MHEDVDAELGTVAALYRYPVKSLAGEELAAAVVEARGLRGDRLWAVRDEDGKLGSGKSTRRFRRMDGLLELAASYPRDVPNGQAPNGSDRPGSDRVRSAGDGSERDGSDPHDGTPPVVTFPDGSALAADDPAVHHALSRHVGRPVTLAREADVSHFDDGPLHLVTTSSLRAVGQALGEPVSERRFRPNLVLDTGDRAGPVEDGWLGRRLRVGDAVLEVVAPMPRCVMVNLPQGDLAAARVLDAVTGLNDGNLGVLATVVEPGRIRVGDPVVATA